ncbi:hypothetical protein SNEBB_006601 [Seison nebaliae]|nr:hypothetical protein SNEBB_006601 [Seison nebaliae]
MYSSVKSERGLWYATKEHVNMGDNEQLPNIHQRSNAGNDGSGKIGGSLHSLKNDNGAIAEKQQQQQAGKKKGRPKGTTRENGYRVSTGRPKGSVNKREPMDAYQQQPNRQTPYYSPHQTHYARNTSQPQQMIDQREFPSGRLRYDSAAHQFIIDVPEVNVSCVISNDHLSAILRMMTFPQIVQLKTTTMSFEERERFFEQNFVNPSVVSKILMDDNYSGCHNNSSAPPPPSNNNNNDNDDIPYQLSGNDGGNANGNPSGPIANTGQSRLYDNRENVSSSMSQNYANSRQIATGSSSNVSPTMVNLSHPTGPHTRINYAHVATSDNGDGGSEMMTDPNLEWQPKKKKGRPKGSTRQNGYKVSPGRPRNCQRGIDMPSENTHPISQHDMTSQYDQHMIDSNAHSMNIES